MPDWDNPGTQLYYRFRELLSAAEAMGDLPVVAKVDEALQTMQEAIVVVVECRIIYYKRIESISGFEAAHFAEYASGRFGGNPEHF